MDGSAVGGGGLPHAGIVNHFSARHPVGRLEIEEVVTANTYRSWTMWTLSTAFPLLGRTSVADRLDSDAPATSEQVLAVMPELLRYLDEVSDVELGSALPGLAGWARYPIPPALFSRRANNTFVAASIDTWGDLASRSLDSLRQVRNVGRRTIGEISRQAVMQSLADSNGAGPTTNEPPTGSNAVQGPSDAEVVLLRFVRQLALWGQLEADGGRLSDLLAVTRPLPPDLEEAWSDAGSFDFARFAVPSSTLDELIELLLDDLEPVWRAVLEERVFADDPITLQELGTKIGLTRERVRQIQVKVEDKIRSRLTLPAFGPLRWRACTLRDGLGDLAPADDPMVLKLFDEVLRPITSSLRPTARALLLFEAGPYSLQDGWLIRAGVPMPKATDLDKLSDEDGLIELGAAEEWLTSVGVRGTFAEVWLRDRAHADLYGDFVLPRRQSVVDKCVARLALRNAPATTEEILAEVGSSHNAKGVRNRFFEDDRLMRVNRSQWALRRWGLEEYTGIADEILQRIEEHGGRVALSWLVGELVTLFNVADGSVRAYAAAPMFVTDADGYVRSRRPDEPYPVEDDLSGCRGVFRTGPHSISVLFGVDRDVLRGSGRSLLPAVAGALGVTPGNPRAFTHAAGEVLVTWPETSALGPSLGSTRALVATVGAEDGQRMRLDFDSELRTVAAERILQDADRSRNERLQSLTGLVIGDDAEVQLATAISSSPVNVRRVLAARGDVEVLHLLGEAKSDPSLAAALADLAGVLDEPETYWPSSRGDPGGG